MFTVSHFGSFQLNFNIGHGFRATALDVYSATALPTWALVIVGSMGSFEPKDFETLCAGTS